MAGVMIGSPLTGMASDHFGRRPILLLCLLMSSVLSILLLFINSVFAVITIRFIVGFFISVSFVIFLYSCHSRILYLKGKLPKIHSIKQLTLALNIEALTIPANRCFFIFNLYFVWNLFYLKPLCPS